MEVLLATLVLVLVSLTYGGPIWPISNLADGRDPSATEVIYRVNQEEDVEPQLFEGDILLGSDDYGATEDGGMRREKRNAIRWRHYIWKAKIIPYEISTQLFQERYDSTIFSAIEEFSKHTCIQWKPRTDEEQWVIFKKKSGCYSWVGVRDYRLPGPQDISLGNGCNHKGVVMHEMMHAAGFWHEQSRYDRDNYVEIFWENIEKGEEHNFDKYDLRDIDYLNEVYDTDSLMHYGKTSFSSNGKPTIQLIGDPNKELGQLNGFSNTDIAQLNALYDCSGPSRGWSSWSSFSPCVEGSVEECVHYRQRFCSSRDRYNCPQADPYGIQIDEQKCSDEKCFAPVDGHWGRWSSWSSCSVTCDQGQHSRTRICNDPFPKNGGKDCQGNSSEVGGCRENGCGLGPNDCEFEARGMCHWTFCNQSNCCPYWILNTGATSSSSTGPQGDHTSGWGNYLYFEASRPAEPGTTSCFSSKVFPAGCCQNLSFWYHMLGSGIGELRVIVNGSVVWRKSGEQGDKWVQASVEIQSDQEFQVTFEGVRGPDYRGDIAVDDIFFKDCEAPKLPCKVPVDGHWGRWSSWSSCSVTCDQGQQSRTRICNDPAPENGGKDCQGNSSEVGGCKQKRCGLGPNDCEFEVGGMCHWTFCQQSNCCPYWKLNTGATRSPSTGPQGDHTSGSGNYLYFEASNPAQPGQTSCFSSKVFPAGSCQCLTFWHHMLGGGIGELRVIVNGSVVWRKSGEQGDKWSQAAVEIQSDQEFQVTFEGVRGPDHRGDIAVDDIFFKDCKAPKVPCRVPVDGQWSRWSSWSSCSVTCDQGVQNRTRICDDPAPKNGGKDCHGNSSEVRGCRRKRCRLGPNDCEFEVGGMCHWTFCQQSNCCPYWKLNTGNTSSPSTGPQGDHTSGSGNYIYFEASDPAEPGDTSCFSSKVFPAGFCQRLIFWYHMLGSGIGELRVIVSGSVVWRKSGEQGDKWSQANIEFRSDQEFQVTFEGVRGPDYRGDIAVDDIFFEDCNAPVPTLPSKGIRQPKYWPSIIALGHLLVVFCR